MGNKFNIKVDNGFVLGRKVSSLEEVVDAVVEYSFETQKSYYTALDSFAEHLRAVAVKKILTGEHKYKIKLKTRIKKGHDLPFLETGFYAKNIVVRTRGRRDKLIGKGSRKGPQTVFIDVMPDKSKIHPNSRGLTLYQIVTWLEKGNRPGQKGRQPPRPFWGGEMSKYARANISNFIVDSNGKIHFKRPE